MVIAGKWGIALPIDPCILKFRWIIFNSIRIGVIKLHKPHYRTTSLSLDHWFSIILIFHMLQKLLLLPLIWYQCWSVGEEGLFYYNEINVTGKKKKKVTTALTMVLLTEGPKFSCKLIFFFILKTVYLIRRMTSIKFTYISDASFFVCVKCVKHLALNSYSV